MNRRPSKPKQRFTLISAATGIIAIIVLAGWYTYLAIAGTPELPITVWAVGYPLWTIAGTAFGICAGTLIDNRMQH